MAGGWGARRARGWSGLAVVAAMGMCVPGASAPDRPQKGAAVNAPKAPRVFRTPWGEPDLQGIWNNNSMTPLERPGAAGAPEEKRFLTDEESESRDEEALARANRDRRDGIGTDNNIRKPLRTR